MAQIDIDVILSDLKMNKSQRTQNSLDKLNELLEIRFNNDECDYSIATIGKISSKQGGVGEVSIRNASGKHYRRLIEAWSSKANADMKKKPVAHSKNNYSTKDEALLQRIDDPILRTLIGQIVAQKKRFETENRILKGQIQLTIDMRPKKDNSMLMNNEILGVTALEDILLETEMDALKDAINPISIARRGLIKTDSGSIKDEGGNTLFKVGFVSGLEKIMKQLKK